MCDFDVVLVGVCDEVVSDVVIVFDVIGVGCGICVFVGCGIRIDDLNLMVG